MKNKKLITLIATCGLITCLYSKVDAVRFYDTLETRYEGAVERLNELEIVDGVANKVFNAEKTVTRAEIAKMLTNALLSEEEFAALIIDDENCNYKDVDKNAWYYEYVVAATNYGLLKGYEDNTFKPNKEVTYEEASKMIVKGLGHTYLREDHPEGWAKEYLSKLYELKINEGTSRFEEKESATRGNIAIMIWNMLTSNVWEKIELNDTTGFTFVDSGKSLFTHKFSEDYSYLKNIEIKEVREINDKLCVKLGSAYYELDDQDATFKMSMLGGKATALLYKKKDKKGNVQDLVVIGISADVGMELKEGTLDELKEDGYSYRNKLFKLSPGGEYGYLIYNEDLETVERVVTFDTDIKQMYVNEIDITTEEPKSEEDELEDEEKEDEVIKTISINEDEYIIYDGAVLFSNNKRIDWDNVKEGDIITEIKENQYYILTRNVQEFTIKNFEKKSNTYIFTTEKGTLQTYPNTQCVEYLSEKTKRLNSVSSKDLEKMIGKAARVYLDFAGKIVRIEFLDTYTETKLTDANIAYFYGIDYSNDEKKTENIITIVADGNKQTYRTEISNTDIEFGDLITLTFDEKGRVDTIDKIDAKKDINDKISVKSLTYKNVMDRIENSEFPEDVLVYHTVYEYDFGKYDEISDFSVKRVGLEIFEELEDGKAEFYVVTDEKNTIKMILVRDFSNKKDLFYGRVNLIFKDKEKDKLKIRISVLGHKEADFEISGLLNCEEGDFISFKIFDDEVMKVVEKYTTKSLGYYKDIIVNKLKTVTTIESEYGLLDMSKDKIVVDGKEYNLKDYIFVLMKVNKGIDGTWKINQVNKVEQKKLVFQVNDRIAIDEIEDTIIIYRGYTE